MIAVRAYNDMGDGAPVYVTTWTKEEPVAETQAPLIPPIGLKAIVLSSTTVVLYWSDMPITKSLVRESVFSFPVQELTISSCS